MQSELPLELGAEKIFLQGTDRAGRGLAIVLVAKHDAWNADRDEVLRSMCYIFDAQVKRSIICFRLVLSAISVEVLYSVVLLN